MLFLALENGHFWRFQVPKNGTLSTHIKPILKNPIFSIVLEQKQKDVFSKRSALSHSRTAPCSNTCEHYTRCHRTMPPSKVTSMHAVTCNTCPGVRFQFCTISMRKNRCTLSHSRTAPPSDSESEDTRRTAPLKSNRDACYDLRHMSGCFIQFGTFSMRTGAERCIFQKGAPCSYSESEDTCKHACYDLRHMSGCHISPASL